MTARISTSERLVELFAAVLNIEVPSIDTDLFESGVLDSLAFVELLLKLEEEFGVTVSIDELEVETFKSIDRIAAFVDARTLQNPRGRLLAMPIRA
jgi:D-alanine--poly(phosphoribitol) ligase subunit 2